MSLLNEYVPRAKQRESPGRLIDRHCIGHRFDIHRPSLRYCIAHRFDGPSPIASVVHRLSFRYKSSIASIVNRSSVRCASVLASIGTVFGNDDSIINGSRPLTQLHARPAVTMPGQSVQRQANRSNVRPIRHNTRPISPASAQSLQKTSPISTNLHC